MVSLVLVLLKLCATVCDVLLYVSFNCFTNIANWMTFERLEPRSQVHVASDYTFFNLQVSQLDVWREPSFSGNPTDIYVSSTDVNDVEIALKTFGWRNKIMVHNLEKIIEEERISNNNFLDNTTMTLTIVTIRSKMIYIDFQKFIQTFSVGISYEGRVMIGVKLLAVLGNNGNDFRPFPYVKHKINFYICNDWNNMTDQIKRCRNTVKAKSFKSFGFQFYGECWYGPPLRVNYKKDGNATNCIEAAGLPSNLKQKRIETLMVYQIND